MKMAIQSLIVSSLAAVALLSALAHADTPVGKMTMKIGDDVTVNQAVLKREIKAIETQIAEVSVEINEVERQANTFIPAIHPGLMGPRDGFSTIISGLKIERAQMMKERRALLSETVTIP